MASSSPKVNAGPDISGSDLLNGVLSAMDPSQRAAAEFAPDTPLLVVAGAGSGKTSTMAARVAFLLASGVPAHRLLGICFTRQSAETLRERVGAMLPVSMRHLAQRVKLKTLHAFGLECLRRFGALRSHTQVYDAKQQQLLADYIVERYAAHLKSSDASQDVVRFVNSAKCRLKPPTRELNPDNQPAYLYPYYEQELHEERRAVDFGDLQKMFYELLRPVSASGSSTSGTQQQQQQPSQQSTDENSVPLSQTEMNGNNCATSPACEVLRRLYTHIIVDEFQDMNEVQFEILALLAGDECRVTCVGDPNQCIYAFRGALPNIFERWHNRFRRAQVHLLECNYRSEPEIVRISNRFIGTTQTAVKGQHSGRSVTLLRCEEEHEELSSTVNIIRDWIAHASRTDGGSLGFADIAVLCRSGKRVTAVCATLKEAGIPVRRLRGLPSDQVDTVKVVLAYLRLCVQPHSNQDIRTALEYGPMHLPRTSRSSFFLCLDAVRRKRVEEWQAMHRSAATRQHGGRRNDDDGDDEELEAWTSYYTILSECVRSEWTAVDKLSDVSKPVRRIIAKVIEVVGTCAQRLRENPDAYRTCVANVIDGVFVGAKLDNASVAMPRRSGKRAREEGGEEEQSSASRQSAGGGRRRRGAASSTDIAQQLASEFSSAPAEPGPAAAAAAADVSEEPQVTLATLHELLLESLERTLETVECQKDEASRVKAELLVKREAEEEVEALTARSSSHGAPRYIDVDAESSVENLSGRSTVVSAGGATLASLEALSDRVTSSTVLCCVIDDFVSLLPEDDYGIPAQRSEGSAGAAEAARAAMVAGGPGRAVSLAGCVSVGTVHAAKGMEWPAVAIPGARIGEFPVKEDLTSRQGAEERKIFYVALSRAMSHVAVIAGGNKGAPLFEKLSKDYAELFT